MKREWEKSEMLINFVQKTCREVSIKLELNVIRVQ
jgi:hypothetical protein